LTPCPSEKFGKNEPPGKYRFNYFAIGLKGKERRVEEQKQMKGLLKRFKQKKPPKKAKKEMEFQKHRTGEAMKESDKNHKT